jgi:hypothetical protein
LQWVEFDGSPESFKAVSTKPLDGISALGQGIAIFHRWACMQGRSLDDCRALPDIFKRCGLEDVQSKVAGTDSDVGTRAECSYTMIVTFDRLFNKLAKVPGSGKYISQSIHFPFQYLESCFYSSDLSSGTRTDETFFNS